MKFKKEDSEMHGSPILDRRFKPILHIIGAGGFAKEVLMNMEYSQYEDTNDAPQSICLYDPDKSVHGNIVLGRYHIMGYIPELLKTARHNNAISHLLFIAIGDPYVRWNVHKELKYLAGFKSIPDAKSIIGTNVVMHTSSRIGDGSIICASSVVTTECTIGNFTIVNQLCSVGHDCIIGDYTTISPNCTISGKTNIGSFCFLGSGVTTAPGVKIGNNCVIGANSFVSKDVPDNSFVVGTPGKIIKAVKIFPNNQE